MKREITLPFDRRTIESLGAYDRLSLNGSLLVGRDQVHQRLCQLLGEGKPLPADLRGETIYYMGPAAAPAQLVMGSCGPTTSARMDPFTPSMLEAGLVAMIGKGPRGDTVINSIKLHGALYLVAFGGCGALYATRVTGSETVAFEDLGPEALMRIHVRDFPVIVGIDSRGNSVFG
ncbi:MAG: FumA C-terminus/TtdB family hydratase beta subunit [Sphaerochaetaceae bacterium]